MILLALQLLKTTITLLKNVSYLDMNIMIKKIINHAISPGEEPHNRIELAFSNQDCPTTKSGT
jgi:hypothetical protein